jgi:hypothetical protein
MGPVTIRNRWRYDSKQTINEKEVFRRRTPVASTLSIPVRFRLANRAGVGAFDPGRTLPPRPLFSTGFHFT